MPVRFRCDHCGQLLAIARRKRGTAVDCPRCHNAIVVPDADRIDRPKPSTSARLFESNEFDRWLGKSAQLGAKESGQSPLFDIAEIPEQIVLEEDVEPPRSGPIMPLAAPASSERRVPQGPPLAADRRFRLLLAIAVISVCLAFFFGLLVGRFLFTHEEKPSLPLKKVSEDVPPAEALAQPKDRELTRLPAPIGPSLQGILQYQDESTTRPDTGAAVIVIPAELELTEKIPIEGLRPEDQPHQNRPGVQHLRAHGGAFEYADGDGSFRIELKEPGKFWVLALSNHRQRADEHPVFPADRSVLNRYFTDPGTLLAGFDYLLISRQVPEGPAQPVIHSF